METRRNLVIFALCLLCAVHAFSQDIRFIQRLSWKADDAALEYRVEVQNTATGKTLTETTKQNFAEFSLAEGSWRYRVSVYNLLGQRASTSRWVSFTVRSSPLPKGDGDEVTQNLSWEATAGARSYRVELQNKDSKETGIFVTAKNQAALSLEPGVYRYRATAYNASGRQLARGDWNEITVFTTNKPQISAVEEVLKTDDGKIALNVDISNIAEGSTVELVRETEEGTFGESRKSVKGKSGDETESANAVYFDKVASGKWRLKVTNPSGLTTESEPFEVQGNDEPPATESEEADPYKDLRPYHAITIAAGVGVLFNPYDGNFSENNTATYFGQHVIPSLTAYAQFLPFRNGRDHWGFAVAFLGTSLFYRSDPYNQNTLFGTLSLKGVYQRALVSDKLYLAFKAGGGVCLTKSDIDYKTESGMNIDIAYLHRFSARAATTGESGGSSSPTLSEGTSFYPCVTGGLSLVWVPFTRFSVEIGADFTHVFISGMPTGLISPYLALGLKL